MVDDDHASLLQLVACAVASSFESRYTFFDLSLGRDSAWLCASRDRWALREKGSREPVGGGRTLRNSAPKPQTIPAPHQ